MIAKDTGSLDFGRACRYLYTQVDHYPKVHMIVNAFCIPHYPRSDWDSETTWTNVYKEQSRKKFAQSTILQSSWLTLSIFEEVLNCAGRGFLSIVDAAPPGYYVDDLGRSWTQETARLTSRLCRVVAPLPDRFLCTAEADSQKIKLLNLLHEHDGNLDHMRPHVQLHARDRSESFISSNAHDLVLVLLKAAKAAPNIDLLQDFVFKRGNDDTMVLLMTKNIVLAHTVYAYPKPASGYTVPTPLAQWAALSAILSVNSGSTSSTGGNEGSLSAR